MNTPYAFCDQTWNYLVGCTRCSLGCANCWAGRLEEGRLKHLGRCTPGFFYGPVEQDAHMSDPRRWRKPHTVAVNLHSDTFHPIAVVAARSMYVVMSEDWGHTYVIPTKRIQNILHIHWQDGNGQTHPPLPNVFLLATICNQAELDRDTPAIMELVRRGWKVIVNFEPLLGPVDYGPMLAFSAPGATTVHRVCGVIVGGETGKEARPMHPNWVRAIRDECKTARVPFYLKQWGEWGDAGSPHDATHTIYRDGIYEKLPAKAYEAAYEPGCLIRRWGSHRLPPKLDGQFHIELPAPLKEIG